MGHIEDCNECMHIGSMSNCVIDYSIFNIKIKKKNDLHYNKKAMTTCLAHTFLAATWIKQT